MIIELFLTCKFFPSTFPSPSPSSFFFWGGGGCVIVQEKNNLRQSYSQERSPSGMLN